MDKGAPIGVFDSGIGGLTVLEEIQQLLPHESLLYVADCGHIPYGEKSPAFILERSRRVAAFFREQGAKAFVIACNTATVAAVADLRLDFPDWPLVGMEPAVKPAAAATRSGVVGVLATTGTLQSAKFAALLDRFATDVKVITQPCPGLVELIESGDLTSPALHQMLQVTSNHCSAPAATPSSSVAPTIPSSSHSWRRCCPQHHSHRHRCRRGPPAQAFAGRARVTG